MENPILVTLLFTAVLIALLYWFFGTELGSGIRATGANPNMSRAQGINVNRNKVLGLMISNGIVALSSACIPSTRDLPMSTAAGAPLSLVWRQ